MKIKLLDNIWEHDRDGKRVGLKVTCRPSRDLAIPWVKGAIIDASDATGQKFIDAGKAERVEEVPVDGDPQ